MRRSRKAGFARGLGAPMPGGSVEDGVSGRTGIGGARVRRGAEQPVFLIGSRSAELIEAGGLRPSRPDGWRQPRPHAPETTKDLSGREASMDDKPAALARWRAHVPARIAPSPPDPHADQRPQALAPRIHRLRRAERHGGAGSTLHSRVARRRRAPPRARDRRGARRAARQAGRGARAHPARGDRPSGGERRQVRAGGRAVTGPPLSRPLPGAQHHARLRDTAHEVNLWLSLASGPAGMRPIDLLITPLLPVLVPLLLALERAAAVERRAHRALFVARRGDPDTLLQAPDGGAVARPIPALVRAQGFLVSDTGVLLAILLFAATGIGGLFLVR